MRHWRKKNVQLHWIFFSFNLHLKTKALLGQNTLKKRKITLNIFLLSVWIHLLILLLLLWDFLPCQMFHLCYWISHMGNPSQSGITLVNKSLPVWGESVWGEWGDTRWCHRGQIYSLDKKGFLCGSVLWALPANPGMRWYHKTYPALIVGQESQTKRSDQNRWV